jgi:hypothetical protein
MLHGFANEALRCATGDNAEGFVEPSGLVTKKDSSLYTLEARGYSPRRDWRKK